jgi:hypothetical protein
VWEVAKWLSAADDPETDFGMMLADMVTAVELFGNPEQFSRGQLFLY